MSVGCINQECCDALVTNAMSKFQYLGIVAFTSVILNIISFFGSILMMKKIKPYKKLKHSFEILELLIMLSVTGFMVYMITNNTPSTPGKPAHIVPYLTS